MKTKMIDGVGHRLLVDGDVIRGTDIHELNDCEYKLVAEIGRASMIGGQIGNGWGVGPNKYYRPIQTEPHIIEKPAKTIRYLVIEGNEYEIPDDAVWAAPDGNGIWFWFFVAKVAVNFDTSRWSIKDGLDCTLICKTEPVENWYQKLVYVGEHNG